MKIDIQDGVDKTTIRLTGDLTIIDGREVEKAIIDRIASSNGKKVVLDLSGVRYVDSLGVASLVNALKESRQKKVDFVLTGVHGKVKEVLDLTRLAHVFPISESAEDKH